MNRRRPREEEYRRILLLFFRGKQPTLQEQHAVFREQGFFGDEEEQRLRSIRAEMAELRDWNRRVEFRNELNERVKYLSFTRTYDGEAEHHWGFSDELVREDYAAAILARDRGIVADVKECRWHVANFGRRFGAEARRDLVEQLLLPISWDEPDGDAREGS
jgi:hypothetical protein